MQRVKKLWWARRSVSLRYARGLHVTQPYSIVSSTSALSIRILSSRGAHGRSYNSGVYFRKLHRVLRMRRPTSIDRSVLWLTFPPRCTHSFVWLYTWPAASTLNVPVDAGIPFARKHIISVLAPDTMRPNAAHNTTIISTIFLSCSGDCVTTPASSALSMPQSGVARTDSPTVACPRPPFLPQVYQSVYDALKRVEATFITAAKKMLNRRGAKRARTLDKGLVPQRTTSSTPCR